MALDYTIGFTDDDKGTITVQPNDTNTETSLTFVGKNKTGYGEIIATNFLQLLENFANSTAPLRPIEGQLWFDNSASVNQLKVYDGTNWVPSGGLKKALNKPSASESVAGDLWVDTGSKQLYLWTGSTWVLVGPEYSDGLTTGAVPEQITGTDDLTYNIVKLQASGQTVAIVSSDSFTPKQNIAGFSTLNPGFNLSGLNLDGVSKFYGTSEKAEALVIGNSTVAAGNFLRADTTSITDFPIKIKTDDGVEVGSAGGFRMFVENQAGIIQLNALDEEIDFRLNNQNQTTTVMRISSQGTVGINNTNPNATLDVTGTITASGKITANNTDDSTDKSTGSLVVKGGLGVAKKLYVGSDTSIEGTLTVRNISPETSELYNIGSGSKKYNEIHANTFQGGTFNGTLVGDFAGNAGTASALASATTFSMTGDVTAPSFNFSGTEGPRSFVTTINNSFIGSKTLTTTSQSTDELILNRTTGSTGVFKTTVGTIINSIATPPIGSMMMFAGSVLPTGWLFCDGSLQNRSTYQKLFQVIGTAYDASVGSAYFRLPDLRGRFPLGKDNMSSPNVGTSPGNTINGYNANVLGNEGGSETKVIQPSNIPEHEHDMRDSLGNQYNAVSDIQNPARPGDVTTSSGPNVQNIDGFERINTSGGVDGVTGQAMDVMNPFTVINYIIYTGGASN